MAEYDDVNTSTLALIGLLGTILVFAVIVSLTVLYSARQEYEDYVKNVGQPYTELENLLAAQRVKLAEYQWVDEKKQVVAIPIDRAMELVVQQYGAAKGGAVRGGKGAGAATVPPATEKKGG